MFDLFSDDILDFNFKILLILDIDQSPLIPDRSGRVFSFTVGQISFGNIVSESQSWKRQIC